MHVEIRKEFSSYLTNRPSFLYQRVSDMTRFLYIKYRRFQDFSRNGETKYVGNVEHVEQMRVL